MNPNSILWFCLGGGILFMIVTASYARRLSLKACFRSAGLLCFLAGGLTVMPAPWWFYLGASGYSEFVNKGGRLDMLGYSSALRFAILFSFPLLGVMSLLFWE